MFSEGFHKKGEKYGLLPYPTHGIHKANVKVGILCSLQKLDIDIPTPKKFDSLKLWNFVIEIPTPKNLILKIPLLKKFESLKLGIPTT